MTDEVMQTYINALQDEGLPKDHKRRVLESMIHKMMPEDYYGTINVFERRGKWTTVLHGTPGCMIPAEIASISHMANAFRNLMPEFNCSFAFSGNDEVIEVPAGMTQEDAAQLWAKRMDERRREYEASPQAVIDRQRATAQKIETQSKIDAMLNELDSVLHNPKKLAAWLALFAMENDSIYAVYDRKELARKLEAAGYISGEFVGADFNAMPPEEQTVNGLRWAVGQGIHMITELNMPIHPALSTHFKKAAEQLPES